MQQVEKFTDAFTNHLSWLNANRLTARYKCYSENSDNSDCGTDDGENDKENRVFVHEPGEETLSLATTGKLNNDTMDSPLN